MVPQQDEAIRLVCDIAWNATQQADWRLRLQAAGVCLSPVSAVPAHGVYLYADDAGLALGKAGAKARVRVDFGSGAARHRRCHGGGELLGRAVKHGSGPRVWDATGGLGRDAFVLASLGLQVTVFERHPVVAALLADGLMRAVACAELAPIVARMRLYVGEMQVRMPALLASEAAPEVVYLDPMYPQRQKSAAVKKEMAYFHELLGAADDEAGLLAAARGIATRRVVVKRPAGGACLAGVKPDFQYRGKNTRFDVYHRSQAMLSQEPVQNHP